MAENGVDANNIAQFVRAHVTLSRQVDRLSAQVSNLFRLVSTVATSDRNLESTKATADLQRLLLFATHNARKVLRAAHQFLPYAAKSLRPGNTFKQGMMRSKASDCTLADFRLLLRSLLRNSSIRCKAYPSEFYAMETDPGQCQSLEIVFEAYADICNALGISADVCQAGVYRELRQSRQVAAVQVTGVIRLGEGQGSERARLLLLGRSTPSMPNDDKVHVLYQNDTAWSENAWESELTYRTITLRNIVESTTSPTPTSDDEKPRKSDLNLPPVQRFCYRISWQRNPDAHRYPAVPANLVSGTIRSQFPVVILGTKILLDSVTKIFTSRKNGELLTDILVNENSSTA